MPCERFLTPAEALGEDIVAKLAELEDQVRQLDLLVANADLTQKHVERLDSVAFCAFEKYASEHEEYWATAPAPDDKQLLYMTYHHVWMNGRSVTR